MSMTLRLDTAGLRSLIEDNPEFKIEIQQSVMNNINRDNLDEAVRVRLELLLASMCTEEGSYYNRKLVAKDPKLVAALTECVREQAQLISANVIQNLVEARIAAEMVNAQKVLTATMKEIMITTLTPELAKEILISKLV